MAGSCWCWLIEQWAASQAAALLSSSSSHPPSFLAVHALQNHKMTRNPGLCCFLAWVKMPCHLWICPLHRLTLNLRKTPTLSLLFPCLFWIHCTIHPSLHNLTFAMRYPHLPYMGEVTKATTDSTCRSTTLPLARSLRHSLWFFPFAPDVLFLSHHYTKSTRF